MIPESKIFICRKVDTKVWKAATKGHAPRTSTYLYAFAFRSRVVAVYSDCRIFRLMALLGDPIRWMLDPKAPLI